MSDSDDRVSDEDFDENEEEDEEEASSGDEEDKAGPSKKTEKVKKRRSAFIDDAAEEDDEGDRRLKRSRFIDDIAEVDDDDEEDEDDEGFEDLIDDAGEVPDVDDVMEVRRAIREAEMKAAKEDDINPEELEKYLKERFGRDRVAAYAADESDLATTAVTQQALMPTAQDPKLWVVRCAENAEREVVVCLLQKCYDYAAKGKPLLIKSAFCKDELKGYMYVESHKEAHVREALKGLRSIFHSKPPKMVPLSEMVDAVTPAPSAIISLKPGNWVRLKAGLYKGDLAKVMDIDPNTGKATIKLVPRLDYNAMANRKPEDARTNFGKQPKIRPPPRPFSVEEARAHRLDVSQHRDRATGELFLVLGASNRFHQGYLVKVAAVKSLTLQTTIPPLDELQRFASAAQDDSAMAGNDLGSLMESLQRDGVDLQAAKLAKFKVGDKVVVVEGDLRDVNGKVEHVTDEGTVMVRIQDESFKDLITFRPQELAKFFEAGDQVKVVHGRYEGETGMVVALDGIKARVFTDSKKEEIVVFSRDLVETAVVASSLDSIGEFDLYDCVQLDPNTFGVIVGVDKESCRVMTNNGRPDKPDIRICRLPELQKKIESRKLVAMDSGRNELRVNDVVDVLDGPLKGRSGTIKHLFRGTLFIQTQGMQEFGGFSVVVARMCKVRGGKKAQGGGGVFATPGRATPGYGGALASPFPTYANANNVGASPAPLGNMRNIGAQQMYSGRVSTHQDRLIIGKTVEIGKGPFRGMRGRIKSATPTHVRVELEAQMKTVTVDRNHIPGLQQPGARGAMRPQQPYGMPAAAPAPPVGRTPAHWSQIGATPAHWSQVGATPLHPGMTPGRDVGKTPAHDPAWMATPAHPGFGDEDDGPGSFLQPGIMPGTLPPPSTGVYQPSTSKAAPLYQPTPAPAVDPLVAARFAHWIGLEVVMSDGVQGVMKNLDSSGQATVVGDNGSSRIVTAPSLRLAQVAKDDSVRLVAGSDTGATGTVVSVDKASGDVIVRLNDGKGSVIVPKEHEVGRVAPR